MAAETPQRERRVKIQSQIDRADRAQGMYADMVMLNDNADGVVIDFIYVQPQAPKAARGRR